MRPELFGLPFVNITVKSYGLMMVVGFLLAVFLMRRMAKRAGENPDSITNISLYALMTGVLGARLFYIIHNLDQFDGNLLGILQVWRGGLEFIGGVILAFVFILVYLYIKKHSMRKYLDMMAVGLMLGLAFGRVGCLLNGCCYGKPTDLPVGIQFPYGSLSYISQVYPDENRERGGVQLDLPAKYYGFLSQDGKNWIEADEKNKFFSPLRPYEYLTDEQRHEVTEGKYQGLHVHPSQIYSSLNAFFLCGILYAFRRRYGEKIPGATFGLAFVLYGAMRFMLEMIRDDNPFEDQWWILYKGGTISQNIGIYLVIAGVVLLFIFVRRARKSGVGFF